MNRPARILYTLPNFITAGSGAAMLNVIERLDRARFDPAICVLRRGGALERKAEALGVPLFEAPFTVAARPLPGLPLRLWRAARAFGCSGRYDLWHSFHYADDYTEPLIARLAGARVWLYTKKNMNWGGRGWHVRTFLAARIAVQNRSMADLFFARVPHKTRLIPCGVDAQTFRPGLPPRRAIRERCGLSADMPLIGCAANLLPIKGQDMLIEALACVPGAALVLAGRAGDAEYARRLHMLCAARGVADRVFFLDEIADMPAFYAELDAFALASQARGEGSPVALLEAMACGLPCVATRVPGSQDLIEPEQSGLLVLPADVQALAGALRALIDSPARRQALGAAARARILAHYTIEREAADYMALYSELLS